MSDEIDRANAARDDRDGPLAVVRRIYADLTDLAERTQPRDCRRRTDCCRFKLTGRTPYLTTGEALLVANALRAAGRRALERRDDGSCPLLDAGDACIVYDDRPFGCRTHFCAAAGGIYPRRLVAGLVARLDELDERLGGRGARALTVAVSDALGAAKVRPRARRR